MGIPHACYTSGHNQPTPAVTNYYLNKFLNPEKLLEVKYCYLPNNMTFKTFKKKHHLTEKKFINLQGNLRLMTLNDVDSVFKLNQKQLEGCKLIYDWTKEDLIHALMPKDNVVWTYVVENLVDGEMTVTDFFSIHRML